MKKIIAVLFAGVLMVSFAACGGSKEGKTDATQEEATEALAPVEEVVDADTALKDFESYVENYVAVIKKMRDGNVSVAGDYSKLSQQKQQYDADMARYAVDFDDAQKKRWEDAGKKLADAIKTLSEKK